MGCSSNDPPEPPNYAAANREALITEFELLPLKRKVEVAAKKGTSVTIEIPGEGEPIYEEKQVPHINPQSGQQYKNPDGSPQFKTERVLVGHKPKEQTFDFTGFGDDELNQIEIENMSASARALADVMLEVQKEHGLDFVEQRRKELEASDPSGFALRERMGQQIFDDLENPFELPDDLRQQVEQSERAAQAARGNVFGSANAAAEALATGQAAFNLRQQRFANASAFLGLQQPVNQFGQLQGAQQGAAPFAPLNNVAPQINHNAGALGAQFAQQNFSNQMQAFEAQQSQGNPWMAGLGMVAGVAATGLTGGIAGAALGVAGGFRGGAKQALGFT